MSSATLKLATLTVKNLNSDTLSLNDNSVYVPGHTDGLYTLINKMITDLSSIKSSIKTREKVIRESIDAEISSNSGTDGVMATGNHVASTLFLSAGIGDSAGRYGASISNEAASEYCSVLSANNNEYAESVVFGVLSQSAQLINKLKNGQLGSGDISLTETTTLSNS